MSQDGGVRKKYCRECLTVLMSDHLMVCPRCLSSNMEQVPSLENSSNGDCLKKFFPKMIKGE